MTDTDNALVLFLVLFGACLVLGALAGAGEWLENRSDWFSRFLDRTVGRPDGWS
jgi:hypothetical protein